MIGVRLIGGLGNQLFQYAFLRARHLETGGREDAFLDCSAFKKYKLHSYSLDPFNIPLRKFNRGQEITWNGLRRIKRLLPAMPLPVQEEQGLRYDPRLAAHHSGFFNGYFQSEKYFVQHADQIRRDLTLKEGWDSEASTQLQKIRQAPVPVSIHVRRGDYVTDPTANRVHGTCDLDYYARACELLRSKFGEIQLFAFSDDPKWVRVQLAHLKIAEVIGGGPERNHFEISLMAQCKHHIIANSSFSWWGAWLNSSAKKIVVAPARWFTDPTREASDIVPESWVKI